MRDPLARRDLLTGSICCAGALLGGSTALWNSPRALPSGGLDALVPRRIAPWTHAANYGAILADTGNDSVGSYDDLVTRIYTSPVEPPVTLLIAYVGSQRADVRLHRPETCYPAAGFTLSERERVRLKFAGLPPISARMILAEAPLRSERLLYWTRVGSEFPTSNISQIGAFVRANLAGNIPDAILMRLSVPGHDRGRAGAAFGVFLTALLAGASPEARRLLFGA